MVEMEQVRAGRGEARVPGNQEGLASSLPEAFLIQLSQLFHYHQLMPRLLYGMEFALLGRR